METPKEAEDKQYRYRNMKAAVFVHGVPLARIKLEREGYSAEEIENLMRWVAEQIDIDYTALQIEVLGFASAEELTN